MNAPGGAGQVAAATAAARRHPFVRRIAEACLVLLFVLLPALVVGAQLDAPATAGELRRLSLAFGADAAALGDASHSLIAEQFYLAALHDLPGVLPTSAAEQAALVGRARLAQFAFVLALSGLVYLVMSLARGRIAGLCACLCLSLLPPVLHEGYVLRPETPAAVFGMLSVLLLLCLARSGAADHGPLRWRSGLQITALLGCACLSLGLALAALPSSSLLLVVPGCVLSLAVLQHGWRGLRILRRRGWLWLPLHAQNRRLLPWTAASLLAPLTVALVVHLAVHGATSELLPTIGNVGLWPGGAWLRLAVVAFAAFGAAAAIVRVGGRFGRRGRIGADLVLLVYCAVELAWYAAEPAPFDGLRAAPAAAMLLGDGLVSLAALAFGLRRGPRITSPRVR